MRDVEGYVLLHSLDWGGAVAVVLGPWCTGVCPRAGGAVSGTVSETVTGRLRGEWATGLWMGTFDFLESKDLPDYNAEVTMVGCEATCE